MLAPVYNVTFFFPFWNNIPLWPISHVRCRRATWVCSTTCALCAGFEAPKKKMKNMEMRSGLLRPPPPAFFLISCFFWVPTQRRVDANSWPEYHYIKMYRNEVIIVVLHSSEIKGIMLDEMIQQNAFFSYFFLRTYFEALHWGISLSINILFLKTS